MEESSSEMGEIPNPSCSNAAWPLLQDATPVPSGQPPLLDAIPALSKVVQPLLQVTEILESPASEVAQPQAKDAVVGEVVPQMVAQTLTIKADVVDQSASDAVEAAFVDQRASSNPIVTQEPSAQTLTTPNPRTAAPADDEFETGNHQTKFSPPSIVGAEHTIVINEENSESSGGHRRQKSAGIRRRPQLDVPQLSQSSAQQSPQISTSIEQPKQPHSDSPNFNELNHASNGYDDDDLDMEYAMEEESFYSDVSAPTYHNHSKNAKAKAKVQRSAGHAAPHQGQQHRFGSDTPAAHLRQQWAVAVLLQRRLATVAV
ncbi:OLC1v1000724C1 [Oldenlandia corymbosa var. corymbosa]|uniref:OLC1v1000724C1 n=1 Tax=Oldenlandia corymbosa var. corymbosa TaxID=529605 RepID=A0AAV1D3I7_OLDCO|nr:OLC1v1000724C1 [Oldenlandia corymbosa var. corymbosa]